MRHERTYKNENFWRWIPDKRLFEERPDSGFRERELGVNGDESDFGHQSNGRRNRHSTGHLKGNEERKSKHHCWSKDVGLTSSRWFQSTKVKPKVGILHDAVKSNDVVRLR